jgi:hypothetical protein
LSELDNGKDIKARHKNLEEGESKTGKPQLEQDKPDSGDTDKLSTAMMRRRRVVALDTKKKVRDVCNCQASVVDRRSCAPSC